MQILKPVLVAIALILCVVLYSATAHCQERSESVSISTAIFVGQLRPDARWLRINCLAGWWWNQK